MECQIREWKIQDATHLVTAINNKNIQNNLRDGLPYPYTEKDAIDFIHTTLLADKHTTFSFAITIKDRIVGSIGVFRQDNIHQYTAEMGNETVTKNLNKYILCRIKI